MLSKISEKVNNNERITPEEALFLLNSNELHLLGQLANTRREYHVGNKAFYQFNYNINYTNICENECKLCAFYKDEANGYTLSVEEITAAVKQIYTAGVNEVHIVGGLNKKLPYSYYIEMLQAIKSIDPAIHIQAFTAVEIDYYAKLVEKPTTEVLQEFKAAGLDSLPGGGAEIFSPRVRKLICDKKTPGEEWLRITEEAHNMGIGSNATMLYGHLETNEEIIDHLVQLRDLQDRTGGFKAFVPLSFFNKNTEIDHIARGSSGIFDMKLMATARIFLDNFPHLKALWMIYGYKACQVGLDYGADDIGGTYYDEEIVHSAGAETPKSLSKDEICELIRKMNRVPVEVNSNYELIEKENTPC
ncbi:MAG: aminofutalosine synthase MqnE [Victivallaceae bacterium]|nr:aminofutalosine synthase MqnE [Victivallaceae bacterium]